MYSLCSFETLHCLSRLTLWSQTMPLLVFFTAPKDARVHCRKRNRALPGGLQTRVPPVKNSLWRQMCPRNTPTKSFVGSCIILPGNKWYNQCLSLVSSSQHSSRMEEWQFLKIQGIRTYWILQNNTPGLCPKEMDLAKWSTWNRKTRQTELTNQGSPSELPWSQTEHVLSPRSHLLTVL